MTENSKRLIIGRDIGAAMTPKQFYRANDRERIEAVCREANTSFANFQQIALAGGSVGKALAKRLHLASDGEMGVLEILYPEDYEEQATA